jgi:hypothetical protein
MWTFILSTVHSSMVKEDLYLSCMPVRKEEHGSLTSLFFPRYELETDDYEYEKIRRSKMSSRKMRVREDHLLKMSVPQLRAFVSRCGIDASSCIEKKEIVNLILASPLIIVERRHAAAARTSHQQQQQQAALSSSSSTESSSSPVYSKSELLAMPVGNLKRLLKSFNVMAGPECIEKKDLVTALINVSEQKN